MKKSAIIIVTLFLLIFVWRWHTAYSLHKPLNLQDVSQIKVWGTQIGSRIVSTEEKEKIIRWFNSAGNIRENKEFAGITPDSGIIIELKPRGSISIINSGKDFEVQRYNILRRRISYWAEQRDIDKLLDQLEKQKK